MDLGRDVTIRVFSRRDSYGRYRSRAHCGVWLELTLIICASPLSIAVLNRHRLH